MSLTLGRVFGIPIRINYTWFLVFFLLTLYLALGELPASYAGLPRPLYWLAGALGSLLLFASVVAHELAHSLVARSQGIPVRSITLFLFGGVASIEQEADRPGEELLMAGVGPVTSLVLALIAAVIAFLFRLGQGGLFLLAGGLFLRLTWWNLFLAGFNLLPGLPLDGGRILRAVLWLLGRNYRRATEIAAGIGRLVAFLLIGGGLVWALSGDWGNGLWLVLIGWFMDNAASQSYQQVLLREALRQVNVATLMSPECPHIPRGLSVASLVDDYILRQGGRCFVVTEDDRLAGLVTMHNVRDLPRERWPYTPVGEIMVPYGRLVLAHPEEDAWSVLLRMDKHNVNQMPVEETGRLVGLIARENLLRYVRTRAELGL
ncbi:MAG: site-2 protease family protein [Chloroflexia bacterium]